MAEIEGMEIVLLTNPAAFLNQFAVHQRNLPSRPAKTDQADATEGAGCF